MTTPKRTLALSLSLEELPHVDVQSASRKQQRLQDVAASVFVISRDDIERSGAASLPEVLRLAPGVEAARLANNRWAVTARGFNGRFVNELLVLLDGRSDYTPSFASVLWEGADTLLDDIERIEVIRGPGASLWGANAVNGAINIITRKARDTWFVTPLTAQGGPKATDVTQIARGVNLLARHEWTGTDGSETALQGHPEHDALGSEGAFHQRRNTIDLDVQNRPRLGAKHDLIWGLGYRATRDEVTGGSSLSFSPERTQWHLVSGFMQDEITVVPEILRVIMGAKLEHNSFSGFEPQPTQRMTWTPTASSACVARSASSSATTGCNSR
jgi:outer membrane receptor for ferrienterochelin and colicin